MVKVITVLLALIVVIITCTGCTNGGYVQLGYIPVTEVRDVHTTIKPTHKPKTVKNEDEDY